MSLTDKQMRKYLAYYVDWYNTHDPKRDRNARIEKHDCLRVVFERNNEKMVYLPEADWAFTFEQFTKWGARACCDRLSRALFSL